VYQVGCVYYLTVFLGSLLVKCELVHISVREEKATIITFGNIRKYDTKFMRSDKKVPGLSAAPSYAQTFFVIMLKNVPSSFHTQ
jgi:hypothetical protein